MTRRPALVHSAGHLYIAGPSFSHIQLHPLEMGGGDSEENVLLARDRAATGLWRIERDEKLGRYMVATRDILPGQLVLAEEPIMWGPNTTNRNLVCLGCFRLIHLKLICLAQVAHIQAHQVLVSYYPGNPLQIHKNLNNTAQANKHTCTIP